MSVTMLCVLKSGGEYRPKHAARLYDQFLRHAPPEVGFLCLTDLAEEVAALNVPAAALHHDWPGWWSKLEVLATPGPGLYLDLDVNIIRDLAPLLEAATQHPFVMASGFWADADPNLVNSSVMAWRGDASALYRLFAATTQMYMEAYKSRTRWGDQAFIRDHWQGEMAFWQDILPGMVLSYKRDVRRGADWSDARVVSSHGRPRPWENGGADDWLMRRVSRVT